MIHKVTINFILAAVLGCFLSVFQQEALAEKIDQSPVSSEVLPTISPKKIDNVKGEMQRDQVIARIADQTITYDAFAKYVIQDTRSVKLATTALGKKQVLRELILDRLLEEGMRREGFLPTDHPPNQADYLRAYNLLATKYFPAAIQTPQEEAVHRYYLDHKDLFGIPAMIRVGQIQFRVPNNANKNERQAVKARAAKVLQRLRSGESFAALAGTMTENPQAKETQGDLGFLPVNQDAWLKKATRGLKVGQYSSVLKSPVGYEILQLKDRRDAVIAPYATVREKVLAKMRQEAQRQGREAYAWRLAKEVGVTVESDEFKGALP